MKLKHLSNDDLHTKTKSMAECERLTTIEILWHLRENERRMLYAQMGYRDLKEYCVKELKYSEGSAWRRISAMRVLQELPEVAEKIRNGDLNLSQLSLVRSHFRENKSTEEEKRKTLSSIENKTAKATDRILAELGFEVSRPIETEKAIKGNKIELTVLLDENLVIELDEIQTLLGKKLTKLELIKFMTKQTLNKLREKNQKALNQISKPKSERVAQPAWRRMASKVGEKVSSSARKRPSRYISKNVSNEVKHRDQNRCRYIDPVSGRRCESIHNLQMEHRLPYAKGGESNDLENLELLCPTHNRLRAVQQFGEQKMQTYIQSLKE